MFQIGSFSIWTNYSKYPLSCGACLKLLNCVVHWDSVSLSYSLVAANTVCLTKYIIHSNSSLSHCCQVERTKDRPLVSGAVSQWDALVFLSGQLGVGLLILLQLNWYSILLGASSLGNSHLSPTHYFLESALVRTPCVLLVTNFKQNVIVEPQILSTALI